MKNLAELNQVIESAAESVLAMVERGKATPIVLIDGPSGSGKTTFASALQNRLFQLGESAPRVVHMDSLYEGWSGLEAGSDYVVRFILSAAHQARTASWQEYDWAANARSGAWREFEGGTPLIVEGCGALSSRASELADLRIWLEADTQLRKQRWSEREPSEHEQFWGVWAAQEAEFYAREKSSELADLKFRVS